MNNRNGWLTRNVLNVYRRAGDEAHTYGDEWYQTAHTFGVGLAERYDLTVRNAIGVIAALSPSCGWERNLMLADMMVRTGDCTHMYGNAIEKARSILDGADPLDILGGDKVRSFFDNILNPVDSLAVTIDRHAFDAAVARIGNDKSRKVLAHGGRMIPDVQGERVTGVYRTLADAYRSAARIVGGRPHEVQAVVWCQWRMEKGIA